MSQQQQESDTEAVPQIAEAELSQPVQQTADQPKQEDGQPSVAE